jgi:hypothetical protein
MCKTKPGLVKVPIITLKGELPCVEMQVSRHAFKIRGHKSQNPKTTEEFFLRWKTIVKSSLWFSSE